MEIYCFYIRLQYIYMLFITYSYGIPLTLADSGA